jgi:transcriptional regulator with XRE-family HTH domain
MNRPTKASLLEIPELDTRAAKVLRRGPRAGRAPFKLTLGEMRKAANKTQEDVARALEVDQAEVSRLEHREDVLLSTLRRYARTLGAECEVVFVFPKTGHRVLALAGDVPDVVARHDGHVAMGKEPVQRRKLGIARPGTEDLEALDLRDNAPKKRKRVHGRFTASKAAKLNTGRGSASKSGGRSSGS